MFKISSYAFIWTLKQKGIIQVELAKKQKKNLTIDFTILNSKKVANKLAKNKNIY